MTLGSDQSVMTTTANFGVIGKGQAVNVFMHAETHITIRPDGTVTVSVENMRLDCK